MAWLFGAAGKAGLGGAGIGGIAGLGAAVLGGKAGFGLDARGGKSGFGIGRAAGIEGLGPGLDAVLAAVPGANLGVALLARKCAGSAEQNGDRRNLQQKQRDGDMNSSEVADFLNLGAADTYCNIKRSKRPFSSGKDGDKGYVEADHIPPLQSLHMARMLPAFQTLRGRNPDLYQMVMSLQDDRHGENLPTVQVPTHHHREALSTGSRRESVKLRELIAHRIAEGDVVRMLQQAFIIAHPFAARQIRAEAGVVGPNPPERFDLSDARVLRIYRNAFLGLLRKYFQMGIIDRTEYEYLMQYVLDDGYLDRKSEEYQQIVEIVRRYGKRKH